jgi:AraC-like DNA-binding protein
MQEFSAGKRDFDRFRDVIHDICDVTTRIAPEEFNNVSVGIALSSARLIDAHSTPVQYERTPRHVAHSGIDHYQLAMHLEGEAELTAGRRTARMRPGDVCLIDMAQENGTRMKAAESGFCRIVSLMVPRALMAPLLAAPDSVSASILSRDTQAGRLVAECLLALRQGAARADDGAAVDDLARLVAGAIGAARDAEIGTARAAREALLASIKCHIETELNAPSLSAAALCRRFGISRAQLYRLFEPDGGLFRYVQDRRLHRAFHLLMSRAGGAARMMDLAFEFRFGSDNTFIRAFRRRFGLTPGEVRELSALRAREGNGSAGVDPIAGIRHLGAA